MESAAYIFRTVVIGNAEKGDPDAQYAVADSYRHGTFGIQQNNEECIRWLNIAAENGHAQAQRILIEQQWDKKKLFAAANHSVYKL